MYFNCNLIWEARGKIAAHVSVLLQSDRSVIVSVVHVEQDCRRRKQEVSHLVISQQTALAILSTCYEYPFL